MKLWLGNQLAMGIAAWDPYVVPADSSCSVAGLGLSYPDGACIEHLFGGGIAIGGIVHGIPHVSNAWNPPYTEFIPGKGDSLHGMIWRTHSGKEELHPNGDGYSGYYFVHNLTVNRKGVDDDGDGLIDEDELDGIDNDGDWNPLTDDLGVDGLPDSLEVRCDGRTYDPISNSDPAFDNYDPNGIDSCRFDALGNYPHKADKHRYTQNNGIADHGEPHVDEDYGAVSDDDVIIVATDTSKDPLFFHQSPLGLRVVQKSYAWHDGDDDSFIPIDYTITNIGKDTIRGVAIGFLMYFQVGPAANPLYSIHGYSCIEPTLRLAYAGNALDSGSTPAGIMLLQSTRPIDSLWLNWHRTFYSDVFENDGWLYEFLNGGIFPAGASIAPCEDPLTGTGESFAYSFGPFPDLKPHDTLRCTIALVAGRYLDDMFDHARRVQLLAAHGFDAASLLPPPLPVESHLIQNYPNPFNPATTISFTIRRLTAVRLEVYDLLGRKVTTLVDDIRWPGDYAVAWKPEQTASGVYFYRLTTREGIGTGKMMYLR